MKKLSLVALFGVVVVVGILGFQAFKPTATATEPIQAVALTATSTSAASTAVTVYQIVPEVSEVRFVVDEVLRGSPYTVIGSTDQVSGQVALDAANASSTQVGTILVNARTLETDDASRNRALQNLILQTDQYEYISFAPSALTGLSATLEPGQSYAAQLAGDLTIKGVTRQTTFDVTVAPANDQVTGRASTTINFADWGVTIPSVPFVASVEDEVRLELDFTANAA